MATSSLVPGDPKALVQQGYDRIADPYLAFAGPRDVPRRNQYLKDLLSHLVPGDKVLELGCGAGVPCTQTLVAHGLDVIGNDISAAQISLAKQYVPEVTLIHGDMTTLIFPPEHFDAVVAFYSISHLPKEEQGHMIGRIASWLKEGGRLLCSFSTEEGDSVLKGWLHPEVNMFSSGLGVEGTRALFAKDGPGKDLGLVVDSVDLEKIGRNEGKFHWIMAVKKLDRDSTTSISTTGSDSDGGV